VRIGVQQADGMSIHKKFSRVLISIGILGTLGGVGGLIGHWYGAQAGAGFSACFAAGLLMGRLTSLEPTSGSKPSKVSHQIRQASKLLQNVLNILTGHNLAHAFHFHLAGKSLYLCSRCSGALLGSLVGVGIFATGWIGLSFPNGAVAFLMALPLCLDWATQTFGYRKSTNRLRFLTGALAGLAIVLLRSSSGMTEAPVLMFDILVFIFSVYLISFLLTLFQNTKKISREER
jgi:uncharacterized membrane protein